MFKVIHILDPIELENKLTTLVKMVPFFTESKLFFSIGSRSCSSTPLGGYHEELPENNVDYIWFKQLHIEEFYDDLVFEYEEVFYRYPAAFISYELSLLFFKPLAWQTPIFIATK